MASQQELSIFVRSTFRSVWSLELLLFLRANRERSWSPAEMVAHLRGSDLLVTRSAESLQAAGLIELGDDGAARYHPVSEDLDQRIAEVEQAYAKSPDAIRRAIISAGSSLTAFAEAFRVRKE